MFATKRRQPWLTAPICERLYPFIGGIVRFEKGVLYCTGGIEDHIYLLVRWRPSATISDLLMNIKSRSSLWVHETFLDLREFAWQEGYSVFSVSKSREEAVTRYIARQQEHHKGEDFKVELLNLLRAHDVEFDEQYVFD